MRLRHAVVRRIVPESGQLWAVPGTIGIKTDERVQNCADLSVIEPHATVVIPFGHLLSDFVRAIVNDDRQGPNPRRSHGNNRRNEIKDLTAAALGSLRRTDHGHARCSVAGADVETGVMYTCPEGSAGTPSEVFPFCAVLSDDVVPPIVTTSYTCPEGAEPTGGVGPSLKCKPTGALGNPGGLYILVDPIDTLVYTCPDGSSGTPSELFPFCMGKKKTPIGSIPTIVAAIVTTTTGCPTSSVMSGTECRKPVANVAQQVTTTYSCPAGAVAEETTEDIIKCVRTTATLVPAIETVVPLCNGVVPTIMGTEGDDELVGTENADVIIGLAGNDRIRGLGGNDVICAGDGTDWGHAGDGQDDLARVDRGPGG